MSTSTLSISSNSDAAQVRAALSPLLESSGGRWGLSVKNNGVEREFRFKTFKRTWEFMNAVAAEAARVKHHPEWSNVYNTTFIRWTTHSPPGLSHLDVQMAAFCDEQGKAFGELPPQPAAAPGQPQEDSSGVSALADSAVKAGGDCCVPKSARSAEQGESGTAKEAEKANLHQKGP